MDLKKLCSKHYHRLVLEGILHSLLVGLAVGFAANTLAALVFWVFDLGGILIPLLIGVGVSALTGVLMYCIKFRPTPLATAMRIDRLGLEERTVTMYELREQNSYIATLQRENAKRHIESVKDKKIRIRIPRAVTCLAVAAVLVGSCMTTVVGLAYSDIIPAGPDIIAPDPMENFVSVTYEASEGGWIVYETEDGVDTLDQVDFLIAPGSSTTSVVAEAEEGWVFIGWDDGYEHAGRQEENVTTDLYFIAMFEEIGEGEEGSDADGGKDGAAGDSEGDKADDVPGGGEANSNSDQNGGQGDKGDGSGADGKNDGGQGSTDEEGEGKGDGQGQGAGGKWDDADTFLDGSQEYHKHQDMFYQIALEIFEANGEIPEELREFFETYIGSL